MSVGRALRARLGGLVAPAVSWTLPCFAYVSLSAAFRAELLYYTALDCYIFNQK